eukprot:Pgem_evm1s7974
MRFFALALATSSAVYADKDFTIGLRTLVLSNTPGDGTEGTQPLAVNKLESVGASFDVVRVLDWKNDMFPGKEMEYENKDPNFNNKTTLLDVLYIAGDKNQPRYNSIIFTDRTMGVYDKTTGLFPSALDLEETYEIEKYCERFGVRKVILASNHDAHKSLFQKEEGGNDFANVRFTKNADGVTHVADSFSNNININSEFKLGRDYTFMSDEINSYWFGVSYDPNVDTDKEITPFLDIKRQEEPDKNEHWSHAGFIYRRSYTSSDHHIEEMHFSWVGAKFYHPGLALSDVWFTWVTQGIYLGQRRVLLNTHIDDVFISTQTYDEKEKARANGIQKPAESDEVPAARTSAEDFQKLADWQKNFNLTLPFGSNYTIEHAVNAQGWNYYNVPNCSSPVFKGIHECCIGPDSDELDKNRPECQANHFTYDKDSPLGKLEKKVIELQDSFLWVSHTWSHMDLLCVESKCPCGAGDVTAQQLPALTCDNFTQNPTCDYKRDGAGIVDEDSGFYNLPKYPTCGYSPYDYIVMELTRNQKWKKENFPNVNVNNWSPNSIVTPRISGLNYTVAIKAMLEAGIYTAVGDNSRTDLKPDNTYHGFNARALVGSNGDQGATFRGEVEAIKTIVPGKEGLLVIPRFATRIYFDCVTPEEDVKQHNTFYGPDCYGNDQDEPPSFGGFKCSRTSAKYSRDLTFPEMLEIEAYETARNLLSYRTDPYMFHQANLVFKQHSDVGGNEHSLLTRWVESTLSIFQKYNTFPILSHTMDNLEKFYRDRMARDACEPRANIEFVGGLPKTINVETSKAECGAGKSNTETVCPVKISITDTAGAFNDVFMKYGTAVKGYTQKEVYGVETTYSYTYSYSKPVREGIEAAASAKAPPTVPVCDYKPPEKKPPTTTPKGAASGLEVFTVTVLAATLGGFFF